MEIDNRKQLKGGRLFLFFSVCVLGLNFVSQALAFPFQCALIIYAVAKCDIRLFPGLFILMLDKSNFTALDAVAVKLRIGFAISPQNVFLIMCFLISLIGVIRNKYDRKTLPFFLPWLLCLYPALAMALPAKEAGLTMLWQTPIVIFLTPALYFWGVQVAKTWDEGKKYFVSAMVCIMAMINILTLLNLFYIFTFSENVLMVGLCVATFLLRTGFFIKIIGCIGVLGAVGCVLFQRYFRALENTGFTSGAEIGSTFTRVSVVVLGVLIIILCLRKKTNNSILKIFPYLALVFCASIFWYSVARTRSTKMSDAVYSDYGNIIERFEFKLIGDRGGVWSAALEDVFKPPYFIKDLGSQVEMVLNYKTGEIGMATKLLPHNQVLTLIDRSGWWLGLFMVFFLWWSHIRAFNCASNMLYDKPLLCALLATYAGVFVPVGLTGQSVLSHLFCSNGLLTMIFPGIIYGVWQYRCQNINRWEGYANPMV